MTPNLGLMSGAHLTHQGLSVYRNTEKTGIPSLCVSDFCDEHCVKMFREMSRVVLGEVHYYMFSQALHAALITLILF